MSADAAKKFMALSIGKFRTSRSRATLWVLLFQIMSPSSPLLNSQKYFLGKAEAVLHLPNILALIRFPLCL